MFDIILTCMIYQIRLPIVIGKQEWYLMTQNIFNYLTTMIFSIFFPLAGGRPLKCILIAHQIFQLPRAGGQQLNAHHGGERTCFHIFGDIC